MLEQRALLLGPWIDAERVPCFRDDSRHRGQIARMIWDPDSDAFLGVARGHPKVRRSWLGWLAGQLVQVFETEDASLLMTLYRPWGPSRTWQVRDAEERGVGFLFRTVLWDAHGRRVATARMPEHDLPGRFVGAGGMQLGTIVRRANESLLLTFGAPLDGDPFARMMLVGATLLWA
jgi:hypothetical protein